MLLFFLLVRLLVLVLLVKAFLEAINTLEESLCWRLLVYLEQDSLSGNRRCSPMASVLGPRFLGTASTMEVIGDQR